MSLYNETTHAILGELAKRPYTAEQMAYALRAKTTTISTILLRLYKQENVDREKIQDGTVVVHPDRGTKRGRYLYVYRLNDKGRRRLNAIVAKEEKERESSSSRKRR